MHLRLETGPNAEPIGLAIVLDSADLERLRELLLAFDRTPPKPTPRYVPIAERLDGKPNMLAEKTTVAGIRDRLERRRTAPPLPQNAPEPTDAKPPQTA